MDIKTLLSYMPKASNNLLQEYNVDSITYQKTNVDENIWDLCISLSVNHPDSNIKPHYIFQFSNVSSLSISDLSGNISLSGIGIHDRKSEGWDLAKRYEVIDVENDKIKFFCASIVIV